MSVRFLKDVLIVLTTCLLVACNRSGRGNEAVTNGQGENDSTLVTMTTLSDVDQWLRRDSDEMKNDRVRRLVDAYNANIVLNSVYTDYDLLSCRLDDSVKVRKAISDIDVAMVRDELVRDELAAYKEDILELMLPDTTAVTVGADDEYNPLQAFNEMYELLVQHFNQRRFGRMSDDSYWAQYDYCPEVPNWIILQDQRGDTSLIVELEQKLEGAKTFDARCIYVIELSHAYLAAARTDNPAISLMEALMDEGEYSPYLNEVWQCWRVLYQSRVGDAKDALIPNDLYNKYRLRCANTILDRLDKRPRDMMAITQFLNLAFCGNILREGEYKKGNQSLVELLYWYPEAALQTDEESEED